MSIHAPFEYLITFYTCKIGDEKDSWRFAQEKQIELEELITEYDVDKELENFDYHNKSDKHGYESKARVFKLEEITFNE